MPADAPGRLAIPTGAEGTTTGSRPCRELPGGSGRPPSIGGGFGCATGRSRSFSGRRRPCAGLRREPGRSIAIQALRCARVILFGAGASTRQDPATGPLAAEKPPWALGSGFVGDGQLVPSLGPARRQNPTAVLRGHAQAEAVLVDALAIVRLKRTLHGEKLQRCSDKREECTCIPLSRQRAVALAMFLFNCVGRFLNWRWAFSPAAMPIPRACPGPFDGSASSPHRSAQGPTTCWFGGG